MKFQGEKKVNSRRFRSKKLQYLKPLQLSFLYSFSNVRVPYSTSRMFVVEVKLCTNSPNKYFYERLKLQSGQFHELFIGTRLNAIRKVASLSMQKP